MSLVLDASMALAWCFDDERTPEIAEMLRRCQKEGVVVPVHWHLEVANGLNMAVRRRKMSAGGRTKSFGILRLLRAVVDGTTPAIAWSDIQALTQAYGITSYDAAYLELAIRRQLPVASLDRALRVAAQAVGVVVG